MNTRYEYKRRTAQKTVDDIPTAFRDRVEEIDGSRGAGRDSKWHIILKDGWCYEQQGQHVIMENRWADAIRWVKASETCTCSSCKHGVV